MDLQTVRNHTCVLLTEGKDGCTILQKNQTLHVPAFFAEEVDPTGAGDCFLAGFATGLLRGLSLEKSVLLGNYLGSLAVREVGIPSFNESSLKRINHEIGVSNVDVSLLA